MERTESSVLPLECALGWVFIYSPINLKLNALQLSICEVLYADSL
jgi:hypothetical protein